MTSTIEYSTSLDDPFTDIIVHNNQFSVPRSPTGRFRRPTKTSSLPFPTIFTTEDDAPPRKSQPQDYRSLTTRNRSYGRSSSSSSLTQRRRPTLQKEKSLRQFLNDERPERRRRLRAKAGCREMDLDAENKSHSSTFSVARSTRRRGSRSVVSEGSGRRSHSSARSSSRPPRPLRRVGSRTPKRRQSSTLRKKCENIDMIF